MKKTILLVDTRYIRRYSKSLSLQAGCVLVAHDGNEAAHENLEPRLAVPSVVTVGDIITPKFRY